MHSKQLKPGKKIYFASDFHLGLPNYKESIEREKIICAWLNEIKHDADTIYLVGDLFDVWFEYKHVVPKGYTRFLGTLAMLSDSGINIEIFTGNHDLWMKDYFLKEMNITVHFNPVLISINNKKFYIAHGDGLGPGDKGYKLLKSIMSNRLAQWIYRRLHPDTGIAIADYFSKKGDKHQLEDATYLGPEKEWLVVHSKNMLTTTHVDYFIYGHRHIMLHLPLNESSFVINLGDWLQYYSYAVFDGQTTTLLSYHKKRDRS